MKFLHAADIHLDSPLRGLNDYEGAPADEIKVASRRALENLVDLAISEQVDFVLIAGDLYDGDWKGYNTGRFFIKQMFRLREANIRLYLIQGNHDAASKMTKALRLPVNHDGSQPMLSHTKPQTIVLEDLGVAIHGRGFAKAAENDNLAKDYPHATPGLFNIGMLHTSLTGAEGHEPYAPCSINDLRSKRYDYWALGHVHSREILPKNPQPDDPPIVFPGNIQGRHIRETGEKGCMLVTLDENGRAQPEFRSLDVFRWHHLEIDATGTERGDDILSQFESLLAEAMKNNAGLPLALRVSVSGVCSADSQFRSDPVRWENEFRAAALGVAGENVWIEKVRFRTATDEDLGSLADTDGPIGELIHYVEKLTTDDHSLGELCAELDSLMRKLPNELKTGPDALVLDDPRQMREYLQDVEPLLVGLLTAREDES